MASTSALFYEDAQRIFDDIDHQFQLTPDTLIDLAKAFLDEFKVGLGNYNHPMALMSVTTSPCLHFLILQGSNSPTFVTGVPDGTETG